MSVIKNISEEKAFETLPRKLLQQCDKKRKNIEDPALTLQAIGLLSNLQSYPEGWELNKTELYTRYEKSGRNVVKKAWDELIEAGYIIQFKIRNKQNYEYHYYFSTSVITKEQIAEKEKFHDAKVCKTFNLKNKEEVESKDSVNTGVPNLKSPDKEVQNKDGNYSRVPNLGIPNTTVESQQSNGYSPNSSDNILHTKDITHKDITHKDITHNNNTGGGSDIEKVFDFYKSEIDRNLPKSIKKNLEVALTQFNFDILMYALNEAVENGKTHYKYIKGILNNLEANNIKTVEEAKNLANNHRRKSNNYKNTTNPSISKELTPKWLEENNEIKTEDISLETAKNDFLNELKNRLDEKFADEYAKSELLNDKKNEFLKNFHWSNEYIKHLKNDRYQFLNDQINLEGDRIQMLKMFNK